MMKKTLLIAVLAVLAPMLGNAAVSKPTLVVDGMRMSRGEVTRLCEMRINYQRGILTRLQDLGKYRTDVDNVEASETEEAGKLPDGTEKAKRIADTAAIVKGARKRIKISVRELSAALGMRPAVQDVRRATIYQIYNAIGDVLRGNNDDDNTLNRTETKGKIPAFLFDLIDVDADGQLSKSEISTYLTSL